MLSTDREQIGRFDYSPKDVVAATASLHLGIEIPDSRFEDFSIVGAPQLIADNACAEFFVLGAAVRGRRGHSIFGDMRSLYTQSEEFVTHC